jgi:hypothetical protein
LATALAATALLAAAFLAGAFLATAIARPPHGYVLPDTSPAGPRGNSVTAIG